MKILRDTILHILGCCMLLTRLNAEATECVYENMRRSYWCLSIKDSLQIYKDFAFIDLQQYYKINKMYISPMSPTMTLSRAVHAQFSVDAKSWDKTQWIISSNINGTFQLFSPTYARFIKVSLEAAVNSGKYKCVQIMPSGCEVDKKDIPHSSFHDKEKSIPSNKDNHTYLYIIFGSILGCLVIAYIATFICMKRRRRLSQRSTSNVTFTSTTSPTTSECVTLLPHDNLPQFNGALPRRNFEDNYTSKRPPLTKNAYQETYVQLHGAQTIPTDNTSDKNNYYESPTDMFKQ